jgi:hypothetical protein
LQFNELPKENPMATQKTARAAMKKAEARRFGTQYLSAERVAEIIRRKGIANCLTGVAA